MAKAKDRNRPIDADKIATRMRQTDQYIQDIGNLLTDCPPELQLRMSSIGDEEAAQL